MSHEETLARVRENTDSGRELREGILEGDWRALLDRYSEFADTRDPDGCLTGSAIRLKSCRTPRRPDDRLIRPTGPRPHLHLMASCHEEERGIWGSFWDQFGGGFSCLDSVLAGKMTSHLDTNYVPTAPEPQDARGFYIHEKGDAWPMFPRSGMDEADFDRFECEQGLDRHAVRAERAGLASELEVRVHPRLPLEVWRVSIRNKGDEPRSVGTTARPDDAARAFSWFARLRVNIDSYPFYYFVPRVVCEGMTEGGALVFLNHDKNNKHPRHSFFMTSPAFGGFDMMGEVFEGTGGRSGMPEAVVLGRCGNSLGLQPYAGLVAAVQFDVELPAGESREWTCVYGACPYESSERTAFLARVRDEVLASPAKVPAAHSTSSGRGSTELAEVRPELRRGAAEVDAAWRRKIDAFKIRTPDGELDRYFNVWSRYQARSQARFCRALDKVGFRDVLQDLLGVCDSEPAYVRRMILRALRYQLPDGRAIRQFEKLPGGGHDMRMYMDSASWIPDTLVRYVKESGDFGVLEEQVPFFDVHALKPDPEDTGTVYEHALRAVRSLATNTGYHGLCRIGYGDWNDALSGIGGERGVSVWLSCACVHAAGLMAELAGHLGNSDDAEEMRRTARTMTELINEHAWDGEWYIYAINERNEPIGSSRNAEGSIHLNVNTWALFTGVAAAARLSSPQAAEPSSPKSAGRALRQAQDAPVVSSSNGGREEAVRKAISRLETPFGHRLLAPSYTAASRTGVGRIADQSPGMFENGSVYTHGESFYLYALIAGGDADGCYRELRRSLPSSQVPDIATGPRHQQSNFTVGPDHPNYGQQLFSNFTGSVAWFRRVIERMVGVGADFDSLVIDPRAPSEWAGYEVFKVWRGRRVRVVCRRARPSTGSGRARREPVERRGAGEKRIVLSEKEYQGRIPLGDLREDAENVVEVLY